MKRNSDLARQNASRFARQFAGPLAVVVVLVMLCMRASADDESAKQAAVSVWATGDCVRVNPETGRYLEDRPDIHADYPSGDYRKSNAIWDAAERRVTLHAARNEFVSFQVVVESDKPVSGVDVRLGSLRGPKGSVISGKNMTLFKAWYLHVTQSSSGYSKLSLGPAWYPDALLPAPEEKRIQFDVPDKNNGIGPGQRNQSLWIDVYVPRDRDAAPPGEYRGDLVVAWPGGRTVINIDLLVWDFALPDRINCRGDVWNGSLRRMTPEMELEYYQMARRHRFLPGVAGYRPKLTVRGRDVSIDWSEYDARLAKYFDGSAFTETHGYWGPGHGVPIDHILLPFNVGWPVPIPETDGRERAEAVWIETARQFKAHFDADPMWRKVKKVVFIGALDESYDESAYKKMIYYCDLLRRAVGKDWFQYRIDGGYNREAMETLEDHVDLWVCHTIGFDEGKMNHFRKRGIETWFYGPMIYERWGNSACGSNTFTDLDLLTCRGIGWAAWKHQCGYCEWEFDAFYDEKSRTFQPEKAGDRAWREAINCRYGKGEYNGSGLLVYRGQPMGLAHPVPSIRLKAHRRGFQDYEYARMVERTGRNEQADRFVDSIIHAVPFGRASIGNTEIWSNNPEKWDAVRTEMGRLLNSTWPRDIVPE